MISPRYRVIIFLEKFLCINRQLITKHDLHLFTPFLPFNNNIVALSVTSVLHRDYKRVN